MINQRIFSKELWEGSKPVYERILEHPFIEELKLGTLSKQTFGYYLQQDALYLIDFAKALSNIAARMNEVSEIIDFLKYAMGAIIGERELHENYLKYYRIEPTNEKNEACFAYTHYLLSTSVMEPIEVAVAAILPCFWVYGEVGLHIYKHSRQNNPFEKWINNYAGEEFSLAVEQALQTAEKMYLSASIKTQQAMKKAAYQSVLLEWKFWDNAYNFKETFSFPMAY